MSNYYNKSIITVIARVYQERLNWKCLIFLVFLAGCSSSPINPKMNQGIITFDIAYTNNSGKSFPLQLLPKTIEMKFNRNYASYTIEDRVGLFSISNIINLSSHRNLTLIKVFDKKYIYKGTSSEVPLFFRSSDAYDVKFMPDTERIAGVLCWKANVTDKALLKSYDILYTSSIKIDELNANTPYVKIKGLMLQFGIQMKNLDMKLTAKKINQKEIDDQEFTIPEGYKYISKNQMEEIINSLLP